MKKYAASLILIVLLVVAAAPVHAASPQIMIDGVVIASDVEPELTGNRTMVPVRIISENLGAKVHWSKSEITITKKDTEITLKPNNATATINGKAVLLDVKPYIKKDRLFVPLRFIAEAFQCKVSYSNSVAAVQSAPLVIDGIAVHELHHEFHMSVGSFVQEIKGNAYREAIYQIFESNKGELLEAPSTILEWHANLDMPGAYAKFGQFDFLDNNGQSIKRFDIFSVMGNSAIAIHDVTKDQWYAFSDEAKKSVLNTIELARMNGFVKVNSY